MVLACSSQVFLKSVRCSLSDHPIATMAKGFYVDRLSFSFHIIFISFKEGGPPANTGLQRGPPDQIVYLLLWWNYTTGRI